MVSYVIGRIIFGSLLHELLRFNGILSRGKFFLPKQ